MKIATLQFAPRLGDVEGNIRRADDLLKRGKDGRSIESMRPEILVLPELAFSGYNFPSLEAIKPYLESQSAGPTAKWAQETAKRLKCKICVGYPEIEKATSSSSPENGNSNPSSDEKYFNSLLIVDENGTILHNYRKRFLYYTDETWASEGDAERSFYTFNFDGQNGLSQQQNRIQTTFGICMDINPYKFEAPFTDWEFANRVIDSKSPLVILSMAWLTLLGQEELAALRDKPDMDTFQYWIRRFWPLLEKKMEHDGDVDDTSGLTKKVIIVFANRAGEEPGAEGKDPARYAGSSAVVAVTQKSSSSVKDAGGAPELDVKILCWDIMGAAEEGLCFADTKADPKLVFGLVPRSDSDSD